MAVKVKVGDVYTDIKMGVGAKGAWGQVTANADKGTDKILVWFTNAEEIPNDTYAVEIVSIEETDLIPKQYNGQWYKNFSVQAKVKAVEGGATAIDLEEEGLPF